MQSVHHLCSCARDASGMDATPTHHEAEARFRQLVEDAGAAPPDAVEYEPDSIVFLWHERQVAVVVDLADVCDAAGGLDSRPAS